MIYLLSYRHDGEHTETILWIGSRMLAQSCCHNINLSPDERRTEHEEDLLYLWESVQRRREQP